MMKKTLTELSASKPEPTDEGAVVRGRILVVDAVTPAPDKDSGSVDIYNYLKIFKTIGFHVVFIPKDMQYSGIYSDSIQNLGVECVYKPLFTSFDKAIGHHAPLSNFIFLYRASVAAPLMDKIRKYAPSSLLVFNTVDLHYLRKQREAEISKSVKKYLAAKRMKTIELGVVRKADATILLNTLEMELVQELIPGARLFHIPVVREIPGPSGISWEKRRDIVFIGGYAHRPNVDAVLFFVNDVWPVLRNEGFPGRFVIAGSNMPAKIASLASDDIVILGQVKDLSELFGSCRYSVAPLRYGAGMKGKVITSLSYGVPCIATTIAAEGTGLIAGEQILVEDDPNQMAKMIYQVYDDKLSWERLSASGLRYCAENCSLESVKKKLDVMLSSLSAR